MQFMSLCTKLTNHVTVSAMTYLLPALMRMLKEEPERFQAVQESIQHVEPGCSHSKTTVTYIEDEREVMVLRGGVLTRMISKVRNICCSYSFCVASASSRLSSDTRYCMWSTTVKRFCKFIFNSFLNILANQWVCHIGNTILN